MKEGIDMKTAIGVVIAILMSSLQGASLSLAQEADYRTIPGQRLGRFELGKPLDAFNLGINTRQDRRLMRGGLPFINTDFYSGPNVKLHSCKTDGLVLAAVVTRMLEHPETDSEIIKYKTVEGIGIGTDETDALRLLGRPAGTGGEWTSRHGAIEVRIRQINCPGLLVRIDEANRKIFEIGVETPGAWAACERAVRARPSAAASGVPLPTDVRVVPPGPTVPPDLAAFSGRWVGVWDGVLDHVFIIEEITPPGARFVYAWGTAPQWDIRRPGWVRASGQFVGAELQGRLPATASVTYRRAQNDTLGATYELGGTSRATMVRLGE
ncbi:MAG: hypothetical protein QME77_01170 [bacterium]|nr:hypothetical protein [bacterium]